MVSSILTVARHFRANGLGVAERIFCFSLAWSVLLWVYPSNLRAETHILIFAGYLDSNIDLQAHKIYKILADGGKLVFVASSFGDWSSIPNAQHFDSSSAEDFSNAVTVAASGLHPGDNLIIDFMGHGKQPDGFDAPKSGGVGLNAMSQLWAGILTYGEIEQVLNALPDLNIFLTGDQCYGGGMHEVSFDLPNVCSTSSSDFRTTSNEISDFGRGVPDSAILRERTR
jgi:hypothetical protein